MHDSSVLQRIRKACDDWDLLLILDEIFTGFGRTGEMFAHQESDVIPDIITLSKALTGGTMALAATVASRNVFDAFLSNDPDGALMHGPTYMANPLHSKLKRTETTRIPLKTGSDFRCFGRVSKSCLVNNTCRVI